MSLEVVIGPMFSGKSSYLLSCIQKHKDAGDPIYIITSSLDKRYTNERKIVSHNQESCVADAAVEDLFNAMINVKFLKAKVVIIEEAQFYTNLVEFVRLAVDVHKKQVIVAGLDGDINRKPFGDLLQLIPLADNIVKLKAKCMKCTNAFEEAIFTSKKYNNNSIIDVGSSDKYEAVCRYHYLKNKYIY